MSGNKIIGQRKFIGKRTFRYHAINHLADISVQRLEHCPVSNIMFQKLFNAVAVRIYVIVDTAE